MLEIIVLNKNVNFVEVKIGMYIFKVALDAVQINLLHEVEENPKADLGRLQVMIDKGGEICS